MFEEGALFCFFVWHMHLRFPDHHCYVRTARFQALLMTFRPRVYCKDCIYVEHYADYRADLTIVCKLERLRLVQTIRVKPHMLLDESDSSNEKFAWHASTKTYVLLRKRQHEQLRPDRKKKVESWEKNLEAAKTSYVWPDCIGTYGSHLISYNYLKQLHSSCAIFLLWKLFIVCDGAATLRGSGEMGGGQKTLVENWLINAIVIRGIKI